MIGSAVRAGKAFVEFTLSDAKAKQQLDTWKGRFLAFASKMKYVAAGVAAAGGVIVAALVKCTKSLISMGSALDDMSKKSGLSVETLSALKYAADQSGASLEAVGMAAKGMAKFMLSAEQGSKATDDVLKRLGVTIGELQDKNHDERFMALAEAVAGVEDPTMRSALAMKVFGKSGDALLPLLDEGPEGIRELMKEAQRLGLVMDAGTAAAAEELGDKVTKLNAQFTAMKMIVGGLVVGPLSDLLNKLSAILAELTAVFNIAGKVNQFTKFLKDPTSVGISGKGGGKGSETYQRNLRAEQFKDWYKGGAAGGDSWFNPNSLGAPQAMGGHAMASNTPGAAAFGERLFAAIRSKVGDAMTSFKNDAMQMQGAPWLQKAEKAIAAGAKFLEAGISGGSGSLGTFNPFAAARTTGQSYEKDMLRAELKAVDLLQKIHEKLDPPVFG